MSLVLGVHGHFKCPLRDATDEFHRRMVGGGTASSQKNAEDFDTRVKFLQFLPVPSRKTFRTTFKERWMSN